MAASGSFKHARKTICTLVPKQLMWSILLAAAILLALLCLRSSVSPDLQSPSYHHRKGSTTSYADSVLSLSSSPELIPTYENANGVEYVWQIPSNPRPRGVLFLAHGCQCRSTFFWDKHPQCKNCSGMPEERTLVLHALASGYAVIAVSSTAECWSSSVDTQKVTKVLTRWLAEKKLEQLPLFGLGASSGGYFISVLAVHIKFQSLVIEISSGRFEAMDFDSSYPPTLFVHMPKDKGLALRIAEARDLLSTKGTRNDEVLCPELKVTPHFFSERIPNLKPEESTKIVAALHQHGHLVHTRQGLYMKFDGRQSGWKMALRKENVLSYDARVKLERPLEEEMNLAYAYHEFTSLPSQQIFDWFEASSSSSLETVKRF